MNAVAVWREGRLRECDVCAPYWDDFRAGILNSRLSRLSL